MAVASVVSPNLNEKDGSGTDSEVDSAAVVGVAFTGVEVRKDGEPPKGGTLVVEELNTDLSPSRGAGAFDSGGDFAIVAVRGSSADFGTLTLSVVLALATVVEERPKFVKPRVPSTVGSIFVSIRCESPKEVLAAVAVASDLKENALTLSELELPIVGLESEPNENDPPPNTGFGNTIVEDNDVVTAGAEVLKDVADEGEGKALLSVVVGEIGSNAAAEAGMLVVPWRSSVPNELNKLIEDGIGACLEAERSSEALLVLVSCFDGANTVLLCINVFTLSIDVVAPFFGALRLVKEKLSPSGLTIVSAPMILPVPTVFWV